MSFVNHGEEITQKLRSIREQIRKRLDNTALLPPEVQSLPLESLRQPQTEELADSDHASRSMCFLPCGKVGD